VNHNPRQKRKQFLVTSFGPPGLWLAVNINAPVALDPWYSSSGVKNSLCIRLYHHYCRRKWASLIETSWELTSTPTLSRITADTAGVESSPFWPTQTRRTPFPAAIFIIICQSNDINLDQIWLFHRGFDCMEHANY
jgi:hypothetical protein